MTFQHPRVLEHIEKNFVLASKVVDPGYIGPDFNEALVRKTFGPSAKPNMTETEFSENLVKRVPSGGANNDVAFVFATSQGQVIHVLPGIWNGEDCANELDYALKLSKKLRGLTLDQQHSLISSTHRERLARLDDESHEGLGLKALKNSLEKTSENPARNILDLPEQEVWNSSARVVGYPYRSLRDMGWMSTYIVSQTKGVSNFFLRIKSMLNLRLLWMKMDKGRCRRVLGHAATA